MHIVWFSDMFDHPKKHRKKYEKYHVGTNILLCLYPKMLLIVLLLYEIQNILKSSVSYFISLYY